jgi:carbamoyltransferase
MCGDEYEVIEVERFISKKNIGLVKYIFMKNRIYAILSSILQYIKTKYRVNEFDICFYNSTVYEAVYEGENEIDYHKLFPAKKYVFFNHQESHAAGTFYQSPYKKATVFSMDGGGNDGICNVYSADRELGLELIGKEPSDFGYTYMLFGDYLSDIKKEKDIFIGNLVYAGKLMGLCSFGKVREDWYPHFKHYYETAPNIIAEIIEERALKRAEIEKLGRKIGVVFDVENRISGQVAYDIAATSQRAFEDSIIAIMKKYYKGGPICFTGGCSLNIILNKRIKDEITNDVFVAPNGNDCGLTLGSVLNFTKPKEPFVATYIGVPILDIHHFWKYFTDDMRIDISGLAKVLAEGSIIGCVRGNSEHGPRALGNRSILCNPCIPEMKDILNAKVKNREWFRPFAPVVRLEDVNKYFEFDAESPYMSFQVRVRPEWQNKLQAITHVDGSARVQTVTREQNQWLYDLLTEVETLTGTGVLLNTSFNVDGKPITTRISEVMEVYEKTKIDGVYVEGFLLLKSKKV